MSGFSRDIRDYIRFDEYDIEERFGSEALRAVMDEVQNQLDQLIDAYDYSGSKSEREFAEEQIQDFEFGEFDAENIAEDYEFAFLSQYMSQSKKDDYNLIQRYVELVGYGSGGGGGGGGGGGSPPPSQETLLERQIRELREELEGFTDTKYIEEIEKQIQGLEKQLRRLRGDED
jgi:hypothetical protein